MPQLMKNCLKMRFPLKILKCFLCILFNVVSLKNGIGKNHKKGIKHGILQECAKTCAMKSKVALLN